MSLAEGGIRVVMLDTSTPIDTEKAIEGLGGDPGVFYEMLGNLENLSMNNCLKELVGAYDNKQY